VSESPNQSIIARTAGVFTHPQGGVTDQELATAVAGRVAIVTGASRGIGEATARRLGAAGATVVLAARSAESLEHVAADIMRAGGQAHPFPADLSDPEQAEAVATLALQKFGHVDILVSNAGKSINRSILASTDRFHDYRRTIDINYLGPVALSLALIPSMKERRSGQIVNVATAGLFTPTAPGWSAYLASKGAFDAFARTAAIELADFGITVTSVYMTLVDTEMSAPSKENFRHVPALTPDEAADRVCRGIARGQDRVQPWWGTPAAMAAQAPPFDLAQRLFFRAAKGAARRQRRRR
jgi:NAD(P)-dependent dehydrogenase (short-subunit alcohol dehydrogenase family)